MAKRKPRACQFRVGQLVLALPALIEQDIPGGVTKEEADQLLKTGVVISKIVRIDRGSGKSDSVTYCLYFRDFPYCLEDTSCIPAKKKSTVTVTG